MDRIPVYRAVEHLVASERGRSALRHLLAWLDDDGLALDALNQEACFTVLSGAWGSCPGSARDFMRQALAAAEQETTTAPRHDEESP